jgi:hypothetical protein
MEPLGGTLESETGFNETAVADLGLSKTPLGKSPERSASDINEFGEIICHGITSLKYFTDDNTF